MELPYRFAVDGCKGKAFEFDASRKRGSFTGIGLKGYFCRVAFPQYQGVF
jgi:hypothetical protein